MTTWLIKHYRVIARALTWIGVLMIVVLSTVPAADRPVTGAGHSTEHFAAFALVAGVFAVGYGVSLVPRLLYAAVFCGAIELLQVPLPTRHARANDFIIDLLVAWAAIVVVACAEGLVGLNHKNSSARQKAK